MGLKIHSEPVDKEYIKDLISKEDPLIIEVGGESGADTLELASLFRNPKIFVFEADLNSISTFLNVIREADSRLSSRIVLIPMAIGNIVGKIPWFSSDSTDKSRYKHDFQKAYSASSSMLNPNYQLEMSPYLIYEKTTVPCTTLDFFTKSWGIEQIDLVWADVNGAEEQLINGGIDTLLYKTRYLHIEFSDKELFDGQITKDDIARKLFNFKELGIYDYLGNYGNLLLENTQL